MNKLLPILALLFFSCYEHIDIDLKEPLNLPPIRGEESQILELNRQELKPNEFIKILLFPFILVKKIFNLFKKSKKKIYSNADFSNTHLQTGNSEEYSNKEKQQILPFAKKRIEQVKKSLSEKLAEIDTKNIDDNRFEQELIYYLEKQDVTEEQVRLSTHLEYFLETMKTDSPNGKKLGFISQEIGREINTIGSKSSDVEMQKIVVQMKDELEKIKEQLLNIL